MGIAAELGAPKILSLVFNDDLLEQVVLLVNVLLVDLLRALSLTHFLRPFHV